MNPKTHYACIDLGSNMCRMLIGYPDKSRPLGFYISKSFSLLISLGKNSSTIDNKGLNRTILCLKKCKKIILQYKENIVVSCIATAIFRSAENAKEILSIIEQKCDLRFRICDPDEEIFLSAHGSQDSFFGKYSFVMDMGGGSTEIGFFERNKNELTMIDWMSMPYGLFYFGQKDEYERVIPTDAHKILIRFAIDAKRIYNEKIPIIISRSGIMTALATFISQQKGIPKHLIYGKTFDLNYILKVMDFILDMDDRALIDDGIVSNVLHIKSTIGSVIFTKQILVNLPIKYVILSSGGVKEGMMNLACKGR